MSTIQDYTPPLDPCLVPDEDGIYHDYANNLMCYQPITDHVRELLLEEREAFETAVIEHIYGKRE